MDKFFNFLEIVNTAELLTESLKESRHTLDYILFEAQGNFKGLEYLKTLLEAIKNNRRITFIHEKFETKRKRKYSLNPYLLKEYQNRWYIVGMVSGMNEFRTFGIDRISELTVSDKTFVPLKREKATTLFDHTIGLTYSLNKLEEIILSFTPLQGKYVKALPFHSSQQLLLDNEEELRISLRIIPNSEFIRQLLMLGSRVKVLQPNWLIEKMKIELKEALEQYK